MESRIHKLVKEKRPNMIVFEDIALQTNPSTLIKLARLQGAIIQMCQEYCISYETYLPTSWRKILEFHQYRMKRSDLKKQAKEYVVNKYKLSVSEDISEAICIGDAYLLDERNKMNGQEKGNYNGNDEKDSKRD